MAPRPASQMPTQDPVLRRRAHPFEVEEQRLRRGTSAKWAAVQADVLPAWVAEMDFGVPPAVRETLLGVVDDEDFGYPFWSGPDPATSAFAARMNELYGWEPDQEGVWVFTNLIQALQVVLENCTLPGDGVAIHIPTYPPFLATIQRSGRRIIPLQLHPSADGWDHDDAGLPDLLSRQGCRLIVLVNPHNPTGTVFDHHRLRSIAAAARSVEAVVFSDEIHAELTFAPHRHIPFATLGGDTPARTVTATSVAKAYNLAGLRCAVTHIGPPALRSRLQAAPLDYFGDPSGLGRLATQAAWLHSQDWLADLQVLLEANRRMVADFVGSSCLDLGYQPPQATYLSWIDFSATPLASDPAGHLLREGRVRLSPGWETSQHTQINTNHWARLNFATSPAILERILHRMEDSLQRAAHRT